MNREASISLLNQAVADELQAVHQYLYFHFHLEDQGFGPLAVLFRKTAIEEMGHIAKLSERILFLKGDVTLQAAGPVERITEPLKILEKAKQMEEGSIEDYNKLAEERHLDGWEKQLDNVKRFGLSYLALQSFNGSHEAKAEGSAT